MNGLLFDPDRPAEVAERIRGLLADAPARRLLAEAGRKRAEYSSWAAETGRLVQAYRRAIVVAQRATLWGRMRAAWISAW